MRSCCHPNSLKRAPNWPYFSAKKGTSDPYFLMQNRELSDKAASLEAHFEVVSFGRTLHPSAMFVPSVRNERPLRPQRATAKWPSSGLNATFAIQNHPNGPFHPSNVLSPFILFQSTNLQSPSFLSVFTTIIAGHYLYSHSQGPFPSSAIASSIDRPPKCSWG